MKEIPQKELKLLLLDMLQDIHLFCEKNNIIYSVAYGTLLGAVRHKGFIPWDDDIDIMLPREDYDRFVASYGSKNYRVIDIASNHDYCLPYAKVEDIRTKMDEGVSNRTQYGVFIDIFPIDNVPDEKYLRRCMFKKKRRWNFVYNIKTVPANWEQRSFIKNFVLSVGKLLLKPLNINYICNKLMTISKEYNSCVTNDASVFVVADNKETEVFPHRLYEDIIKMPFESIVVNAVREYDKYLTGCYGDYMKLPPKEKQVSNHSFKVWWVN